MNEFLLRLLDLILEAFPVTFVDADEMGIMLLAGRFWRILEPGWYWKVPYICTARKCKSVLTPINASDQAVTDATGHSWSLSLAVLFSIIDVKKALLNTTDVGEALINEAMSEAASVVSRVPQLSYDTVCREVRENLEPLADRIGVEIEDVRMTDFVQSKTLRLMGTGMSK